MLLSPNAAIAGAVTSPKFYLDVSVVNLMAPAPASPLPARAGLPAPWRLSASISLQPKIIWV